MKQKAELIPLWRELPVKIGLWITGIVTVIFFTFLIVGSVCKDGGECVSKAMYLWRASPNEIGDTLAGYAGTLAFVWIIVTVFLQATELREQRGELSAQREEMEEQRKATQEMAKSMTAQMVFYKDEQLQRNENRLDELCEELLRNVLDARNDLISNHLTWYSQGPMRDDFNNDTGLKLIWMPAFTGEIEKDLKLLYFELMKGVGNLRTQIDKNLIVSKPKKPDSSIEFIEFLDRINDIHEELSLSQQARLERTFVLSIGDLIWGVLEDQNFWNSSDGIEEPRP